MAFAPTPARNWWCSLRRSLANRCIRHRWGGCCAGSACRDRRRGPAIRCNSRLPPRLLKKARRILQTIQRTHQRKRLRLFFQDEARIGQKGRVCHIWWKRGERPPGLVDQRYVNAYIVIAHADVGSVTPADKGNPFKVRRIASSAPMALRRPVSTTDLTSA